VNPPAGGRTAIFYSASVAGMCAKNGGWFSFLIFLLTFFLDKKVREN
jgi:hypothetical protein